MARERGFGSARSVAARRHPGSQPGASIATRTGRVREAARGRLRGGQVQEGQGQRQRGGTSWAWRW
eukprot:5689316-Pyramimonas_sp.AAC.1